MTNTPSSGSNHAPLPSRLRRGASTPPTLLAIGAAAVLAAYSAGYVRTEAAATELAARSAPRRRVPVAGPDAIPNGTSNAAARDASAPVPAVVITPDDAVVASTESAPQLGARGDADKSASSASPAVLPDNVAKPAAAVPPAAASVTLAGAPSVIGATSTSIATIAVTPAPAPVVATPTVATASAPAPSPAPAAVDSSKKVKWKDGTFTGWGTSRHGDIEATVIIEGGKITAAAISRCLTRYSCSWIAHLQPQVAQRQSPEIDNVSGATDSTNAFYYAIVEALKHATP
ncbi:FMN-binding protein [Gemmatimonas sp.]|uniref:FMN-binding protein n=1 Tax=Gemmatimonas sp. TaxID=1962908 RepID=UPI0033405202